MEFPLFSCPICVEIKSFYEKEAGKILVMQTSGIHLFAASVEARLEKLNMQEIICSHNDMLLYCHYFTGKRNIVRNKLLV